MSDLKTRLHAFVDELEEDAIDVVPMVIRKDGNVGVPKGLKMSIAGLIIRAIGHAIFEGHRPAQPPSGAG